MAVAVAALVVSAGAGSAGAAVDSTFASSVILLGLQTAPTAVVDGGSGRVLVAGRRDGAVWPTDYPGWIIRLQSNGSSDGSFGSAYGQVSLPFSVLAVAVDSRGRVLVGGGSSTSSVVVRLTETGDIDSTFGTNGYATFDVSPTASEWVQGMATDQFGNIDIVGHIFAGNPQPIYAARLTSQGVLDTTFGTGGVVDPGLALPGDIALGDGRIYVSGRIGSDAAVLALTSTGAPDPTFGNAGLATFDTGGIESAHALAASPGGGVIVAGASRSLDPSTFSGLGYVAKIDDTGMLDAGFATAGIFRVVSSSLSWSDIFDVAVSSTGRVVFGGLGFPATPGYPTGVLGLLTPSGHLDSGLNGTCGAVGGGPVLAVTFDADGRVPVVRTFLRTETVSQSSAIVARFVLAAPEAACDTTPPTVTVPSPTVSATSAAGATVTFTASATDNIDGLLVTTCTPASGSTFAIGATNVTCSATDPSGNTGTGTGTVTVVDTTGPTLRGLVPISAAASSPQGATVTYAVTASDTVDGSVAVTCSPASGSLFPLGETTVRCDTSDTRGNQSHGTFTVTVSRTDYTAPQINVQSGVTVDATSLSGAVVTYAASATDNQDPNPHLSCAPASATTFAIGDTAVNCSATDSWGNQSSATFTVTVRGAIEQVNRLRAAVAALLDRTTAGALDSKLQTVVDGLTSGKTSKSCSNLNDFINLVAAQAGKKIGATTANALIADATRIREVIGC